MPLQDSGSPVELAGPHGFEHGWRYVGGAGLPSVAARNIHRPQAASLKAGDKVAALFSHKGAVGPLGSGPARTLQTHHVMSVTHSGSGKNRRTHLVLKNAKTGEVRRQSVPSRTRMTARIAKAPGLAPIKNGAVSRQSSFRASGVGLAHGGAAMGNSAFDLATYAGAPPGSGANFAALKGALAARGVRNPGGLAAHIGRKKYGRAGMAKMSAAGRHSHANPDLGIYLGVTAKDNQGHTLTCPECGHVAPSSHFGVSGTPVDKSPDLLRTPAPGTGFVRNGAATSVASKTPAHALSNTRRALELAATALGPRRPIHGPMDVLASRGEDGVAVLKHRHGGTTIATLRKTDAGKWVASVNGRDLQPHDHQRTALLDAVGAWNSTLSRAVQPQPGPLQGPPAQTSLMEQFGIPAVRSAAFATPVTGVTDGPRTTTASGGGDSDSDDNGLTPKGQGIYKKLLARGFPAARAMAFAKRAQSFGKSD